MSEELPAAGYWTGFDQLRAAQDKQLHMVFEQVGRSPFYRERFGGRPVTELDGLPMTSKDDLRDSYPFGMLAVPKARLATYHESSGTSGAATPTPTYYTAQEWDELVDRFLRNSIPMTADDTLLVRIPYALVMAGHLAHQAGLAVGATVIPSDCRSLASPYSRVVRALHDLDVTLTWSTPSEVLVWAAGARLAGYRTETDFPSLRAFYTAGEPLSPARRARISEVWGGTPVLDVYGSTEVGSVAGTCPAGVMHFWADRLLPEVYDAETGAFAREGSGQLVVTPLYQEAMPLIRYDLGDHVEIHYDECACGWYLPTIRVLGRISHGNEVAGRSLSVRQVEEAVYRLPAGLGVLFWRAKAHPERLVVQIEVEHEHAADAVSGLLAIIEELLDVPATVEPVPPGTLVPAELLTGRLDAMKPRRLFGPDEDWDAAVLRC
ncbi:phenylacetate--CoA ligase family protein [Sphaerisporangium rubeum]|uniref:Phenylacetate-CoA ligase n=1 Tax=Sphaerisporangium rubeum TaxID=321317 RepID=A0A7X0IA57_9ACTN|nr:AMP-binding protein [Sphaerisporangium rubeum]MBB6471461.1 phenylacetate-CoA ligase [Sphaerisporangium rubeum]